MKIRATIGLFKNSIPDNFVESVWIISKTLFKINFYEMSYSD